MSNKREDIRRALLGGALKASSKVITVFGVEMELRQPSFASILDARDESDEKTRAAKMIVQYAYVPGTDERIFEDSDTQMILEWPFGSDLLLLQRTVSELTGVDIGKAEAELKKDPLPVSSPSTP